MCHEHSQANTAHIYATESKRDQQMTEVVGIPLLITFPPSVTLVSMTMVERRCSQIIRQKSPTVLGMGPWAAM